MGNSSTIAIYDNHDGNGSKPHISTRPSYFSIEELPSTLEEGFRFRPSHPRDEEEGDEENEDEYDDDNQDNDAVQRGNGKWKPGVKEWLVLICVSIVVMMDAFDATVIIPLVSVCKYLFSSLFGHLLLIYCESEVKKYHSVLASIPYFQQTSPEHPMASHRIPPIQRRRPGHLRHAHRDIRPWTTSSGRPSLRHSRDRSLRWIAGLPRIARRPSSPGNWRRRRDGDITLDRDG